MMKRIMLLTVILLTACSNQPESVVIQANKTDESSFKAPSDERLTSIQGYKEFEFGMSSSDMAKTKACDKSYRSYSEMDRLPVLIDEAKQELDKDPSAADKDNQFNLQVKPLVDKFEMVKSYDLSVTNEWLRHQYIPCETEILSVKRNLQLWVYPDSGLLAKITIPLGQYKDEVFHSIAESLATKYVVSYLPDNSQIKMFNEVGVESVAVSYAEGQVMLVARNYKSYRGNERDMELIYADKNNADQLNRLLTKGKVNVNDL